jgi:hypothetical protein
MLGREILLLEAEIEGNDDLLTPKFKLKLYRSYRLRLFLPKLDERFSD